jgi:hypothetical protein
MTDPFKVTMHGESGDLEVYDNPGADDPAIDSWDAAIRAAWVRLGPTGGGWAAATVVGPYGRTVHLDAADVEAYFAAIARRATDHDRAQLAVSRPEPLFNDEEPFDES